MKDIDLGRRRIGWAEALRRDRWLYAFMVPGILYAIVFHYIPMGGVVIAFQDYDMFSPAGPIGAMFTSPWVGLKHFARFFESGDFWPVFRNTLIISLYKIVFLFPLPIALALLINELRGRLFKRVSQTLLYLPHFLSWVVISGLFFQLLNPYGPVNSFLLKLGIVDNPVNYFREPDLFRSLLVSTAGWKETGWNTIIYLAAITAIDQEMYEAALIDGAGKIRQTISITLPSLLPTILLSFTIRLGYLLDAGFDQVFNMYNPLVYETGDIIGTYVYRMGLGQLDYSLSTAVGLFNSAIGLILILSANKASRRWFGKGIW